MIVCEAATQQRLPYICFFRGRCLAAGVAYSHYLATGLHAAICIVAYLLHARTVEPQKQRFLSNTRMQQWNNFVMQPVSKQRLGKRVPPHNSTELCFLRVVRAEGL
jgi:hypothetical protein